MVSRTSESYDPNGLLGGDYPRQAKKVTVVDSVALEKGAVLGRITSGGKYKLSAAADSDGSETPTAILAEDTDASGGDVEALVYLSGEFVSDELNFGSGHDAASVESAFRAAQAPLFVVERTAL